MKNIDQKTIDVLIREYEMHRQELLMQIELHNRETKYIQVFGTFILGIAIFLLGINSDRIKYWLIKNIFSNDIPSIDLRFTSLPTFIILIFLILAAIIVFYITSTVMASSFMFLILRRRMGLIEQKINQLLNNPGLLDYESRVTRNFLESKSYGPYHFAPHLLYGIWRMLIFISVIVILCWLALRTLPTKTGQIYCLTIISLGLFQLFQYVIMYERKSKKCINDYIIYREKIIPK